LTLQEIDETGVVDGFPPPRQKRGLIRLRGIESQSHVAVLEFDSGGPALRLALSTNKAAGNVVVEID